MDGNHEFKKKKYDIAIDNYTEGIKLRCPDKLLNAVLYTNRAAAQFHRGVERFFNYSFKLLLFVNYLSPNYCFLKYICHSD